jgi:hypothetical protein
VLGRAAAASRSRRPHQPGNGHGNSLLARPTVAVITDEGAAIPLCQIAAVLGGAKTKQRIPFAFVPVDPTYPAERIRYMLEDASVDCVVVDEMYAEDVWTKLFSSSPPEKESKSHSSSKTGASSATNSSGSQEWSPPWFSLDVRTHVAITRGATGKSEEMNGSDTTQHTLRTPCQFRYVDHRIGILLLMTFSRTQKRPSKSCVW